MDFKYYFMQFSVGIYLLLNFILKTLTICMQFRVLRGGIKLMDTYD